MAELHMGMAEARFAELAWDNEPVASGQLAKLAETELGWKKTTSFTVLKRLCERGIFRNEGGTVTACIGKEEYYARHCEQYVAENFGGSLPAFLTAFGSRKKLNDKEYDELRTLIDRMRG